MMGLLLELAGNLGSGSPLLWTKWQRLTEVADAERHGGLLPVAKILAVLAGKVHQKMLEEVDRVKDGHKLKGELRPILREFHIDNYITWSILVDINLTHMKYFYSKINPKFHEQPTTAKLQ